MNQHIEQMTRDLAMAGYVEETRDSYLRTLKLLAAEFRRPLEELSRDDLRSFVEKLISQGRSASWLKMHLAALAFFYRRTLGRPEMVSFVSFPRQYSALPTVLSVDEVQRLLAAIQHPVYQAVAVVMYDAGLRISEALALEVGDVDKARGVLHIRHGKGNRPRQVKLSPELYAWLRRHWARERPPLPYLLASRKTGKPPEPDTIRAALRLAARQAGIQKSVSPHVLRHCYATHLLEAGTDVRVVSALLGHASVEVTARYARVTEKVVQKSPSPLELIAQKRR